MTRKKNYNCSNEIKLVDAPEYGYYVTDKPNPRGQICVRGPNLFTKVRFYFETFLSIKKQIRKRHDAQSIDLQYLGDEEEAEASRKEVDENGWFKTGDLGTWLPCRALQIIDRSSNTLVTSSHQVIHIQKLEQLYSQSPFVFQIFITPMSPNVPVLFLSFPFLSFPFLFFSFLFFSFLFFSFLFFPQSVRGKFQNQRLARKPLNNQPIRIIPLSLLWITLLNHFMTGLHPVHHHLLPITPLSGRNPLNLLINMSTEGLKGFCLNTLQGHCLSIISRTKPMTQPKK